ncbi:MAG: hypothetical protein HQM09_18750 [Candidatus Riflebacteria bacterium]|nr:hypothetical protein [Candidatus Riflebacteria bacterium]
MSKYFIDALNQKFEFRNYKIFFAVKDGAHAEEIIDTLDRATPGTMNVFCLSTEPGAELYLYPDLPSIEKVMGRPLGAGEQIRVLYDENTMLLASPRLPSPLGEEMVRNLGYILFHREVKERDIALHQLRTPSWLREGICMQISVRMRPQSNGFLMNGWSRLQEAEAADKLIKPSVMVKNIAIIPDSARRQLAFHQSYFMVKFLMTIYCNKFVQRYGTLMRALEDMDAEDAFRQVTSFDYEKFHVLFREWVRSTNALVAVSD